MDSEEEEEEEEEETWSSVKKGKVSEWKMTSTNSSNVPKTQPSKDLKIKRSKQSKRK